MLFSFTHALKLTAITRHDAVSQRFHCIGCIERQLIVPGRPREEEEEEEWNKPSSTMSGKQHSSRTDLVRNSLLFFFLAVFPSSTTEQARYQFRQLGDGGWLWPDLNHIPSLWGICICLSVIKRTDLFSSRSVFCSCFRNSFPRSFFFGNKSNSMISWKKRRVRGSYLTNGDHRFLHSSLDVSMKSWFHGLPLIYYRQKENVYFSSFIRYGLDRVPYQGIFNW